MDIVIVKLVGGEELICEKKVVGETDLYSRLRVVGASEAPDGQSVKLELYHYFISDTDRKDIPLNPWAIICEFPAPAALSKAYTTAVSGIALV